MTRPGGYPAGSKPMGEVKPPPPSATTTGAQHTAPVALELTAMQAVADALEPLDGEARARVIRWANGRFPGRVYRDSLNG